MKALILVSDSGSIVINARVDYRGDSTLNVEQTLYVEETVGLNVRCEGYRVTQYPQNLRLEVV